MACLRTPPYRYVPRVLSVYLAVIVWLHLVNVYNPKDAKMSNEKWDLDEGIPPSYYALPAVGKHQEGVALITTRSLIRQPYYHPLGLLQPRQLA